MSSNTHFILFLICLYSFFSSHHASTSRPTGFSAKVINRNSVQSPLYDPRLTRQDRIKASVLLSVARHNYIESITSPNSTDIPVLPADCEYIMEYFIGTPPLRTFGLLDTGSSKVWLQCLPCQKCYPQTKIPYFNPAKSSTYRRVRCHLLTCVLYGSEHCSRDNFCQFHIGYRDRSFSSGDVAEETVEFRSTKGDSTTVENFVFGCSHNNYRAGYVGDSPWGIPGILGLNRRGQSLIQQLTISKFAYCFGDYDVPEQHGYAMFGDVANVSGPSTPILRYTDAARNYYLDIVDISVDGVRIKIPTGVFKLHKEYPSGFLIDSGTTFTFLRTKAFRLLVSALKMKLIKWKEKEVISPTGQFDLCYRMNYSDLKSAPVITFHFVNLDLRLPLSNTWIKVDKAQTTPYEGVHCLAMYPTESTSILGNFQQQNFRVGYDLDNTLISFSYEFCE
ncbi:Aspartyl protease family protein [Thalictrum thalictroides]|uniref:Aspartyl protease family protein n=1 Tax=Thalictrum thalictroides TaxID=46969 RepID=A0A7J6WXQ0_THATH|nr:Aspartyl protease family protein [Thalictrum thalictroides]